ncbi:MAG: DUF1330 domain-containing protein [Pseudomonadota bacterium]
MAAYLIAIVEITDAAAYAIYRTGVPAIVAAYGGRFLVRGGPQDVREGEWPGGRTVVIEFPDRTAAARFYDSAEYQAILPIRVGASRSNLILVEGIEPS